MRGQHTLHTNLLPKSVTVIAANKGKRNIHATRRDLVLAARYLYYSHIKRLRYDDCLSKLEIEFFITPAVIVKRLLDKETYLKELVKEEPQNLLGTLRKEHPYFVWA